MGGYSRIVGAGTYERAMAVARGTYQRAIIDGTEAISGATLRGKAKKYRGRYQQSAYALLDRLEAAGIPCGIETEKSGCLVVVIGEAVRYTHVEQAVALRLPRLCAGTKTIIPEHEFPNNARVSYVGLTPIILVDRHDGKRSRCQTWLALDVEGMTARVATLAAPHDTVLDAFARGADGESIAVSIEWMAEFQRAVTMATARSNQ